MKNRVFIAFLMVLLTFGAMATKDYDYELNAMNFDGPYDMAIMNGAIHFLNEQCADGGWGWTVHGVCPEAGSPLNTIGPIVDGLLVAYKKSGLGVIKNGALNATAHGLTTEFAAGNPKFWSATAIHLWNVWETTGDDYYRDFATNNLYEKLEASAYGAGENMDADDLIGIYRLPATRHDINLRAKELSNHVLAAERFCYQEISDKFKIAIVGALNDLTNTTTYFSGGVERFKPWDVAGIAGAVHGLASVNYVEDFPAAINAPNHPGVNGLTNLEALADLLAGLQNENGSYYMSSGAALGVDPIPETQATAYAVVALVKAQERFPGKNYHVNIEMAKDWLASTQGEDGSFPVAIGYEPNSQIEAEILQALGAEGVYDRIFQGQMECYVN